MRRLAAVFFLVLGSIAPAAADELFRCVLTEAGGVSAAEAGTAVGLICDDLRRESGGRGAFEIRLGTLGSLVSVTATRLDTGESISVRAEGLEEIPLASDADRRRPRAPPNPGHHAARGQPPRGRDARGPGQAGLGQVHPRRGGSRVHRSRGPRRGLLAGPDVRDAAVCPPGRDTLRLGRQRVPGAGDEPLLGQRRRARLPLEAGRQPLLGGGLGLLAGLEADEGEYPYPGGPSSGYFQAEWFGLAPYVEAGVEVLRLHRGRIALHVRADFPLASLQSREIEVWSEWDSPERPSRVPAQSRYVVPVSIGISVAF